MLQCSNADCRLRFPLDLFKFEGRYCPRCSAALIVDREITPNTLIPETKAGSAHPISVVLDNIRSAYNVGAIFRTADGANINTIFLCGITPTPSENPAVSKTALGADKNIVWHYRSNALDLIKKLKSQGVTILTLEITPQAHSIFNWLRETEINQPVALIAGNEPAGVDPALLELADAVLYLPMAGKKNSLNVSVALGIALYLLRFGSP